MMNRDIRDSLHIVQALQSAERRLVRANELQAKRMLLLQDATRGKCSKGSAGLSCASSNKRMMAQYRLEQEELEVWGHYSQKLEVQQEERRQRANGYFYELDADRKGIASASNQSPIGHGAVKQDREHVRCFSGHVCAIC